VLNSSFNPKIKENEIINKDQKINFEELSEKHIKYVLLKSKDLKSKAINNPFLKNKKVFKDWSVFEL